VFFILAAKIRFFVGDMFTFAQILMSKRNGLMDDNGLFSVFCLYINLIVR